MGSTACQCIVHADPIRIFRDHDMHFGFITDVMPVF